MGLHCYHNKSESNYTVYYDRNLFLKNVLIKIARTTFYKGIGNNYSITKKCCYEKLLILIKNCVSIVCNLFTVSRDYSIVCAICFL